MELRGPRLSRPTSAGMDVTSEPHTALPPVSSEMPPERESQHPNVTNRWYRKPAVSRSVKRLRVPAGLIVIALLVRLVIAPYTSDAYDDVTWFHASLAGYYGLHLYDRPGFSYPPMWGYFLEAIGLAGRLAAWPAAAFGSVNPQFSQAASTTGDFSDVVISPAFNVAFKTVLFAFDVGIALIIWRLVGLLAGSEKRANWAMAAWLLNPFTIYQTAVHGAADVLVGFSVLGSVALVIYRRNFPAGALWVFGILSKATPAVLLLQFLCTLTIGVTARARSTSARVSALVQFGMGAVLSGVLLLGPELAFGSMAGLMHNVFARTQGSVVIGGFTIFGVRYFREWSWLLPWAFNNSQTVISATTEAQILVVLFWAIWTAAIGRRSTIFALLAGTVGTLISFTLLSPVSNPQYILWWLPTLIVLIFASGRGYLELVAISVAGLVFSVAILGPFALLGPLATYTHLLSDNLVSTKVIDWYLAPAHLWGVTAPDDFFAPSVIVSIGCFMSLFGTWTVMALRQKMPRWRLSGPEAV